jgi:hypothetical protein
MFDADWTHGFSCRSGSSRGERKMTGRNRRLAAAVIWVSRLRIATSTE